MYVFMRMFLTCVRSTMWVSLESILKLPPQLQWYIRNNVHSSLDLILHTKNESDHEKQIYKNISDGSCHHFHVVELW